jgi:hypothetical protein
MRLVDERGRLFGLVNLVDLVVVLVVVALVAAGAYKVLAVRAGPVRTPRMAELTLLAAEVRDVTVNVVAGGAQVWEHDSGLPFGTVARVQVLPATKHTATADGRWVLAEMPERYDLLVTLRVPALVSETAITIGRMETRIGTKVTIKTAYYALETRVVGIKLVD